MNDKILIIGGSGYVGTRLVEHLSEFKVSILDVVSPLADNVNFFKGRYQDFDREFFKNFDIIILLAGQCSVKSSEDVLDSVDNNIRNFSFLLSCLSTTQKFIYASSASIYGNTNGNEAVEDQTPSNPLTIYDLSKKCIDDIAALSEKNYFGLRFGTVCGFSKNFRNDVFINSMTNNALTDGVVNLSNGNVNRGVLGISDLCRAVELIIKDKDSFSKRGIYNLSSFNITIKQAADFVYNRFEDIELIEVIDDSNQKLNFDKRTVYDFKINSSKFSKTFNFEFLDTIDSIVEEISANFNKKEISTNRLENNYKEFFEIKNCRVCDKKTISLLNLNKQPLANSNHDNNTVLRKYPLHLQVCPGCFHVQLNCVVNPKFLFEDYQYVSGTSSTLKKYFEDFSIYTILRYFNNFEKKKSLKILDIACNDGTQLDCFKQTGCDDYIETTTVGVDPAKNIYEKVSKYKKDHDIYPNYFDEKIRDILKKKYGTFDIIVAQNVFAHIDYPKHFLELCKSLMSEHSLLFIQTSQKDMILKNQFDTAYHEHLSFFNTNSMNIVCKNAGLILNNVSENEIHGQSYIFEIINRSEPLENSNKYDVLGNELARGMYDLETYEKYKYKCLIYKNNFHNLLSTFKLENKNIVCFGSTAKSNVLFNFCGIDNNIIDFIIDENSLKHNLLTPGSDIPIYGIDKLKECVNLEDYVFIITAWNFYNEVRAKIINYFSDFKINTTITIVNCNNLKIDKIFI